MNADPVPAVSTNADLYVVPMRRRRAQDHDDPRGGRLARVLSPREVAHGWRAQMRAGYESDHGA